ncbi:MAG: ABC transporter permease [Planctomycetota bacterium]
MTEPSTPKIAVAALPATQAALEEKVKTETYWGMVWRLFKSNRFALLGLIILLTMYVLAMAAPLIATHKPLVWRAPDVKEAVAGAEPIYRTTFPAFRAFLETDNTLDRVFNCMAVFWLSMAFLPLIRWRLGEKKSHWTFRKHAVVSLIVVWIFLLLGLSFSFPFDGDAAVTMLRSDIRSVDIDRFINLGFIIAPLLLAYPAMRLFFNEQHKEQWTILRHLTAMGVIVSIILIVGLFTGGMQTIPADQKRHINVLFKTFVWGFDFLSIMIIAATVYGVLYCANVKRPKYYWLGAPVLAILVASVLLIASPTGVRFNIENLCNIKMKAGLDSANYYEDALIARTSGDERFFALFSPIAYGPIQDNTTEKLMPPGINTFRRRNKLIENYMIRFVDVDESERRALFKQLNTQQGKPSDDESVDSRLRTLQWPLEEMLPDVETYSGADLAAIEPYLEPGERIDDLLGAILRVESDRRVRLLGTDDTGRDVASRMIHGTRIALSVGFVSVGLSAFIGLIIGSLAGFFGGWTDIIISRFIELVICFPSFFLILMIVAVTRPSLFNIMIIIGLTGWTGIARLVRGEFLKLRNQDFVSAARALGLPNSRVIFRHILPNAIGPVFVSISFGVAGAILSESGLSFLGIGVSPPTPTWGELLNQAYLYVDIAWWLVAFPGFAIFITVTAFNLVGDGLRDAIDPRMKR